MIAAMDVNRAIGYQGKIPWHIKEDLLRFKHLTTGRTVIFGRKTYESLLGYYQRSGRPMPERKTIIVSRSESHESHKTHETHWTHSIEEAISLAKKIEPEEVFISGGAQIFEQGIKYAEKLYLTIVEGKFKADTFFPDYSDFKKKIFKKESSSEKLQYRFVELIR